MPSAWSPRCVGSMIEEVPSKQWHSRERPWLGVSLAGDSMPLRMRSVTIGLVGLFTAVGLGLVALFAQSGFPGGVNAPLPKAPLAGVVHNDTIGLAGAPAPDPGAGDDEGDSRPPARGASSPPLSNSPGMVTAVDQSPTVVATPGDRPSSTHPETRPAPDTKPSEGEPVADGDPEVVEESSAPGEPPSESSEPPPETAETTAPGRSGQAPGHTSGKGPPPWAGNGKGSGVAAEASGEPGKPSWAGH